MDEFKQYTDEEIEHGFIIDNDVKAQWALEKIAEEEAAADAYISVCKSKIDYYKNLIAARESATGDRTANLRALLAIYMVSGAKVKKSKTQEKMELPGGTVIRKYESQKLVPDEDKLIAEYDGTDYVEHTPKLKWGELKKALSIVGGDVVINSETGAVVEGVDIEYVPEKIEVKANG